MTAELTAAALQRFLDANASERGATVAAVTRLTRGEQVMSGWSLPGR